MAHVERTGAQDCDWWQKKPPVRLPVPLAQAADLVTGELTIPGSRVIIGDSTNDIWLYDQRAATGIHPYQDGQAVGVLPESDWFRVRRDPSYVAVPHTVPVDQVWIEFLASSDDGEPILPYQEDIAPESRSQRLVPDIKSPPVRWPRLATKVTSVLGARCWIVSPDGVLPGFRALTEPYRTKPGTVPRVNLREGLDGLDKPVVTTSVTVTHERDWYRWKDTGDTRDMMLIEIETSLVWLE